MNFDQKIFDSKSDIETAFLINQVIHFQLITTQLTEFEKSGI